MAQSDLVKNRTCKNSSMGNKTSDYTLLKHVQQHGNLLDSLYLTPHRLHLTSTSLSFLQRSCTTSNRS